MVYSFAEYADMVLIYGEVQGNSSEAARIYAERFPNRDKPHKDIFRRLVQKLRDQGSFKLQEGAGRPRYRRTVQLEEEVLSMIAANPSISTRTIANAVDVSQSTVHQILQEEKLHPYHIQKVQALGPNDFEPRMNFCRWFLRKCEENPQFPKLVLFSDEATFSREGMWNSHNCHIWEQENPHAIRSASFQQKFSVNVWVGILNEDFVGPFLLPSNLNGHQYLAFLQEHIFNVLQDLPLNIRRDMWFQQDGAPPHFHREVRGYLDATFNRRWIARGGPVAWPPRSPDLTPIDFFVWGYVKSLIYENLEEILSEEELIARINAAFEEIRSKRGIFRNVYRAMRRRCRKCISVQGQQFQHLLS